MLLSQSFCPEKVFVTVGTTSFDELIQIVTSAETVNQLKRLGSKRLTVQTGGCQIHTKDVADIELVSYKYSSNLERDIMRADLIIGHAGAGTCIEVLRCRKRLLVVTNDSLMDGHQDELADQLTHDRYLIKTKLSNFHENLEKICCNQLQLRAFPSADESNFEAIFNEALTKTSVI